MSAPARNPPATADPVKGLSTAGRKRKPSEINSASKGPKAPPTFGLVESGSTCTSATNIM